MKIIIATHDGYKLLFDLLSDIERYGVKNEDVCIVDNLSDNKNHLEYLKSLKIKKYNILYNEEATYEVGAYKWAIEHGIKSDIYFFFQDSIRLKSNIFETIPPKLTNNNVYTFLTFAAKIHDHDPNDKKCLLEHYGTLDYSKGIFGNMFFARDEVIQKVKDQWILPRNKLGSTTAERGLSVIFDRNNIEIIGMAEYNTANNPTGEGYPFFRKINAFTWRQ